MGEQSPFSSNVAGVRLFCGHTTACTQTRAPFRSRGWFALLQLKGSPVIVAVGNIGPTLHLYRPTLEDCVAGAAPSRCWDLVRDSSRNRLPYVEVGRRQSWGARYREHCQLSGRFGQRNRGHLISKDCRMPALGIRATYGAGTVSARRCSGSNQRFVWPGQLSWYLCSQAAAERLSPVVEGAARRTRHRLV